MFANKFDTVSHRITDLFNPLPANREVCRSSHGYCKHTQEFCWHIDRDKDERMIKRSCKIKIGCGKQPIRTNTLPISAPNKWRQNRVHSTEKTSPIPLRRLPIPCSDLQQRMGYQCVDHDQESGLKKTPEVNHTECQLQHASSWFCTYRLTCLLIYSHLCLDLNPVWPLHVILLPLMST